ncbi:MAG TPA: glycoside hydrolase family 2 TIM barrel-domain containing protein [Terriglobia bacterium]|nr:glycoside hydrolase family 2 TIM barrel-domain containing protein [Terriglobia bacterium]
MVSRLRHALPVLVLLCMNSPASAQQPAGNSVSLDGNWHFLAEPAGTLKVEDLARAQNVLPTDVPSSWQLQFPDLRDYAGVAWYWRSVQVEAPAPDRVALLHFGAVDYRADVYVNGQKAGQHDGGYLPFELDVTSLLRAGENTIAVRVADPGAKPNEVEGIKYAEIPHGKQNWYIQTSGLWQSVELEIRPRMHLGTVHITARADGSFNIDAPVVNASALPSGGAVYVGAEILDAANQAVWKQNQNLASAQARAQFSGKVERASLWSPGSPTLYTLHTWLSSGDSQQVRFGFRTFETRDGKFYLNGGLLYLRGALDQDFYPDTGYTPPSILYVRDEMIKAKALGLNLLRCHIKVPDSRYVEAADEVGILIWYEIPNWDKLTPDSERRAAETLAGMVDRDWNHPSIVIVSVINESWGADLKQAADRQWLKQAYHEAKKIVPGWLVDDNSACCDNFHVATDLADFHQYNAVPDHAADFDRFVGDLATRPGWLFTPYNDGEPRGDEPLMLSEFGNWGLPRVPDPRPWWFARDLNGNEFTRPTGFDQRFADHQYVTLFPSLNALADATQRHEGQSLKYEIESLRQHPEIQGYVITEFTDINWESNGLLDLWRHPKAFAAELSELQKDDLVMLGAPQRNWTAGEHVEATAGFSHYGNEPLSNPVATWELEGTSLSGTLTVPPVVTGSVTALGKIQFAAPSASSPSRHALKIKVAAAGKTISQNSLDLFFYPPRVHDLEPSVAFHDPTGRLRRLVTEMRARNYLAPSGGEALPVTIASVFDDSVKQTLAAGGRVILIANDPQTLGPGVEIVPRGGSDLSGDWISSFLWVRKDASPFAALAFDTLAGFETQAVTPAAVVRGIPAAAFPDVLAGVFYGWLHDNVGALVQARYGKGKLLVCTFSLATSYGTDPYATLLLDQLVAYAVSGPVPGYQIPGIE